MAGTIFTPVTLWEDFTLNLPIDERVIEEYEKDGIVYRKIYFSGRKTERGTVDIYALAAFDKNLKKMPAVLILPNYAKCVDEATVTLFARRGYFAFMVDYGGDYSTTLEYTKYPDDVAYANATADRDRIHRVEKDAKSTCWYEWVCVARYAFYYLTNNPMVSGVGAYGCRHGATLLWQLAALEKDLKCFVASFSAGWRAYRGYYKFGDMPEPELNEEIYKYLAGIEPQSYAQYVSCPVLILSSTNNWFFDADRAGDTAARVDKKYGCWLNYSVQTNKVLDYACFTDTQVFLEKFLKGEKISMPKDPEITAEIEHGVILVKVKPDRRGLVSLTLYGAEETVNPALRCWNTVAEKVKETEEYTLYKFSPYKFSGQAFFFVKAKYASGFKVCSRIISKRFTPDEAVNDNKSNIIFSARENKYLMQPLKSVDEGIVSYMRVSDAAEIKLKSGAFDIEGITCKGGFKSFKINAEKDKPRENSVLLLDVYSPNPNRITISLTENYGLPDETVYSVTMELSGGEVWKNISLAISKFKTDESRILKSFENVNCISFDCDGEYLLNNILWV